MGRKRWQIGAALALLIPVSCALVTAGASLTTPAKAPAPVPSVSAAPTPFPLLTPAPQPTPEVKEKLEISPELLFLRKQIREVFGSDLPPELAELLAQVVPGADPELAAELRRAATDAQLKELFSEGEAAVVLAEANTGEWLYSLNPDRPMVAASTYKLFVMTDILWHVQDGSLPWASYIGNQSVSLCLSSMVVESDNECSEEWLYLMGYDHLDQVAQQMSATETSFQPGNLITTAADLSQLLTQLWQGRLLDEKHTQYALDLMAEQIFREGIPAGLGPDVWVADKVGWLDGVYNDAGIFRLPEGDEGVMVILTEGLSPTVTARAAAIMYQWTYTGRDDNHN